MRNCNRSCYLYRILCHAHAPDFWSSRVGWLVGVVAAGGPVGEDAVADEVVGELGQAVVGVCFEGFLEALVGFAAVAFPPLDDTQAGQHRCGVCAVRAHIELE